MCHYQLVLDDVSHFTWWYGPKYEMKTLLKIDRHDKLSVQPRMLKRPGEGNWVK